MSVSLDVTETAEVLAQACLPEFGDGAAVFLVGPSREIETVAVEHIDPGSLELLRELVDEEHFRAGSRIEPTSVISVPLAARGRAIGALAVRREGGDRYTEADLAVVQELARRGAVAIDNALLYARERSAALMLQRSLLPRILPTLAAASCAARYVPGAAGAEVGGDWYDVLALDGDAVAVAVGDVQCRGLVAASVVGQLRAAVRAYALEDHEPREVVLRADRVVSSLDDGPLATCSYARYDPATATIVLANAGHLPPLLVGPEGPRFVELDPGLPLGVGGASFTQTSVAVEVGLVEGPRTPLDEGMARLAAVAGEAAAAGLGVEETADLIIDRLVPGGSHDDDVALLVLAFGAGTTDRLVELTDDPMAVRSARRVAEEVASDELADAWGVEPTSGGKCVWFEISAGAAGPPPASPCPTEVPDGPPA